MKKKVVAAALICSVFGSSHAANNGSFDDYGGAYHSEIQRPVQRLDRFRRMGKRTSLPVNNRFSDRGHSDSNYVINDQTGEKVFLDNMSSQTQQRRAPQLDSQSQNHQRSHYDSRYASEEMQRAQKSSSNYESSRFEADHSNSNNKTMGSQYDFTNVSNDRVANQQWRSQGNTHGRFAAANSHRNKLDQVQNKHSQSWNQESSRNEGWNNSVANHRDENNWQNQTPQNFSRRSWDNVEPSQIKNGKTMEQTSLSMQKDFNQNVDRYNSGNTRPEGNSENYAMDRRSFWPTRAQQTRHVSQNDSSIHHKTDDLPRADRRIQSRMEDPKEFDRNQQMVNSNRAQLQRADESQYQSLRRPRVRVDLRQNQSDRRKRHRRSWLPNPFRGVSRMFSGIFGRR